jgi:hypothetical protein
MEILLVAARSRRLGENIDRESRQSSGGAVVAAKAR